MEGCGYKTGKPTLKFLDKASSQWFGTGDKRTFAFKQSEDNEIQKLRDSLTQQTSLF